MMSERIIRPGVVQKIVDFSKIDGKQYTRDEVNDILSYFLNVIVNEVSKGNSICLNGYMTIEMQYRAERKARNVNENTPIIVPEQYRVRIKPGTKLNQAAINCTNAVFKRNTEKKEWEHYVK